LPTPLQSPSSDSQLAMVQQGLATLPHMLQECLNEEGKLASEKAKMQRQISGESTASTADPVA